MLPMRIPRRAGRLIVVAVLIAATTAIAAGGHGRRGSGGTRCTSAGAQARGAVPHLNRVVLIVFENNDYANVIGSSAAPTFNRLARRYALASNYCAVAHPSLPNYLALASGSTQGITNDCTDCNIDARNLADTVEAAHKTWAVYAEGLPAPGFTGARAGRYAKKHEPFVYFRSVFSNRRRLSRIVPLSRLSRSTRLADFTLIVPDMCHNMHDCSVAQGDAWLKRFLPRIQGSPQLTGGAIFIVFDEADGGDSGGGGHVPLIVLGPMVRPHSRVTSRLSHYSLLRTIEDALRLPRLGRSSSAPPITGIWK
jgi:phosphatidylinositol-3-phosphatase